jgi:anti-anti-sigma factor
MMEASSPLRLETIDGVIVASFTRQPRSPGIELPDAFTDLFEQVQVAATRSVVLDLTEITYFDSSSLGALVTMKQKIDRLEGQIVLCCISSTLIEILKVVRFYKLFSIFDDRASALNSITSRASQD